MKTKPNVCCKLTERVAAQENLIHTTKAGAQLGIAIETLGEAKGF